MDLAECLLLGDVGGRMFTEFRRDITVDLGWEWMEDYCTTPGWVVRFRVEGYYCRFRVGG